MLTFSSARSSKRHPVRTDALPIRVRVSQNGLVRVGAKVRDRDKVRVRVWDRVRATRAKLRN